VLKRLDLFDQSANYAKESRESYQEGNPMPVKPSAGFALRAVQNGEVVDFTPAIAYNPETKLPPSAADAKESIEFYQKDVAERFPNAKIEVALFREYPVGPRSDLSAKGPVGTMAFTPGRMSIDGEMPRYGNSVVAGEGLLKLSTGKLMSNGKRRGEENDWANNVLVSSAKHHVHEMVKDAQGERLKVSEQLDINYPRQRAEAPAPEAKQEEKSEPPKAASEDEGMDAALRQASAMSNKGPSQ